MDSDFTMILDKMMQDKDWFSRMVIIVIPDSNVSAERMVLKGKG